MAEFSVSPEEFKKLVRVSNMRRGKKRKDQMDDAMKTLDEKSKYARIFKERSIDLRF